MTDTSMIPSSQRMRNSMVGRMGITPTAPAQRVVSSVGYDTGVQTANADAIAKMRLAGASDEQILRVVSARDPGAKALMAAGATPDQVFRAMVTTRTGQPYVDETHTRGNIAELERGARGREFRQTEAARPKQNPLQRAGSDVAEAFGAGTESIAAGKQRAASGGLGNFAVGQGQQLAGVLSQAFSPLNAARAPIGRISERQGMGDVATIPFDIATILVAPETIAKGAAPAARVLAGAGDALETAGKGVGAMRRAIAPADPVTTVNRLRQAKSDAYNIVDNLGVQYTPEATNRMIAEVTAETRAQRINPRVHPMATTRLKDVAKLKDRPVTLSELDDERKIIGRDVAGAASKSERYMGRDMIRAIDEFMNNPAPGDVMASRAPGATGQTATTGAAEINKARDLNTRYSKASAVADALERARLQAGSTGSGGNINNAIRQKLRVVMEKTKNLTPDEKAAFEKIVIGGKGQNVMRQVGELSPAGSGLNAMLHMGAAIKTGGATLPIAVLSHIAKLGADAMTQHRVAELIELIARGGVK
jgi:hypothetical protein